MQVGEQRQVLAQELELLGLGLLDLDHHLLRPGIGGASARSSPRRRRSRSSLIEAPAPAPVSTNTLIPLRSSSRTPSGVIATRCSAVFTSFGHADGPDCSAGISHGAQHYAGAAGAQTGRRTSCYNTPMKAFSNFVNGKSVEARGRADARRRQPGDGREVRHRAAVRTGRRRRRDGRRGRRPSRVGATRRRRSARSPCSASPTRSRPAPTS